MSTVPGQLANLMAGYLLRQLTSITETVSSYLGPPPPPPSTPPPPPSQDQREAGACQANPIAGNGPKERSCIGKAASQMTTRWEGDSEASRATSSPRGLVIKDPNEQAAQSSKQIPVREISQSGYNFRSPPVEPPPPPQLAGGGGDGATGHPRPTPEVTDWCRWPVCAVFRWSGQCPLGEYQCPDAHVGPEFLSQIDSNGLVRVCFESLGLGNKPCTRPIGCCRFFHPPEHIRLALIRSRHAATAHAARRRQQKPYYCYSVNEEDRQPQARQVLRSRVATTPNPTPSAELRLTDRNVLEAIRLLSGLMDYGQLLRTCAAIVMRDADWSPDALAAVAAAAAAATATGTTNGQSETRTMDEEVVQGCADQQGGDLAVAAALNRQLAAYSNLTEALRSQLALSCKKTV